MQVATTIVAGSIARSPDAVFWVVTQYVPSTLPCFHRPLLTGLCSSWSFYVPMFGTLITLGLLYWKRHSVPLNYVLLSTFTLLEAFTLGVMTAFFKSEVVLQAL